MSSQGTRPGQKTLWPTGVMKMLEWFLLLLFKFFCCCNCFRVVV